MPARVKTLTVFERLAAELGLGKVWPEYQFYLPRRWRFDYAFPDVKVALEIEGGAFSQGRHTRGKGFLADMEKYNEAVCLGWRVIRCTPQQRNDGSILVTLKRLV